MASEQRGALETVATTVGLAAVVALGISAGAQIAEQALLVPYWQALAPQEFLAWYRVNGAHLTAFFAPLQVVSTILVLAAAGLYSGTRRVGRGAFLAAAALAIGVLLLFPLYFRDVNASFANGTIALDAVSAELVRWASWQWMRVAIGVGAFTAALLAVRDRAY